MVDLYLFARRETISICTYIGFQVFLGVGKGSQTYICCNLFYEIHKTFFKVFLEVLAA